MREQNTNAKTKGLLLDAAIYLSAFAAASILFALTENLFAAAAAFTAVATGWIFVFSTVFSDVSIYDPYWSVAPVAILLAGMLKYRLWTVNGWILLAIVGIWSLRLTGNWYITYQGLGREDWRYAMYREKYSAPVFLLISFTGLHFIPTIVVYGGVVSALFAIREERFAPLSLIGAAIMLAAVMLEFSADRSVHRFLREHRGEKKTCDLSVWKYSRHPNYLGEMSFWTGMYLYFLALCPGNWYKGLGFLSILALFLAVSIPMMEKHNLARREDYAQYQAETSMLLLLPRKAAPDDAGERSPVSKNS